MPTTQRGNVSKNANNFARLIFLLKTLRPVSEVP